MSEEAVKPIRQLALCHIGPPDEPFGTQTIVHAVNGAIFGQGSAQWTLCGRFWLVRSWIGKISDVECPGCAASIVAEFLKQTPDQ